MAKIRSGVRVMAIKVIRHGTKLIAECECCGCLFEYENEDIKEIQLHLNEYRKYVRCPECNSEIYLFWVCKGGEK
jgi:hypothetical protein